MGPYKRTQSKLLELLDTQVQGSIQWVLLEISWNVVYFWWGGGYIQLLYWLIGGFGSRWFDTPKSHNPFHKGDPFKKNNQTTGPQTTN